MFLVNFAVNYPLYFISKYMEQLRKYTWLIEKIRMAGKISNKDMSDKWERAVDYRDGRPLHSATFNRWREVT